MFVFVFRILCRRRYLKVVIGLAFVTLLFHFTSSSRYYHGDIRPVPVVCEDTGLLTTPNVLLPDSENTCSNYSWNSKSGQLEDDASFPNAKDIEKVFYRLFEPRKCFWFWPCASGLSKKARVDKMVLLRKLVLYSVHLLNQQQVNHLCVKWWANPLTTWHFSSTPVNSEVTEWTLRFRLEPGQIPVEAVIRQKAFTQFPINLKTQRELDLVSVTQFGLKNNHPKTLDCLCESEKAEAELRSMEARAEWNKTDPELKYWPPNSSFIFTDYVDFQYKSYFLKSPGKFRNQNTTYCGPTVRIIVLIHSAPNNFERRAIIRKTYGSRHNLEPFRAQVVFFLGTVKDSRVQELVNQEIEKFDDIVQANFVDSYLNVPLKHLSLLLWIYLKCGTGSQNETQQMPRHILKADDDVVINMETIVRIANYSPDAGMIGVQKCEKPIRDNVKNYIPKYMYPPEAFHGYLVGGAYILRSQLIPGLLQASLTTPFVHLDDILFVGGQLSRQIDVIPEISSFFSFSRSPEKPCRTRLRATSQMYNKPNEMLIYWNHTFLQPFPSNCSVATVDFMSIRKECPDSNYV